MNSNEYVCVDEYEGAYVGTIEQILEWQEEQGIPFLRCRYYKQGIPFLRCRYYKLGDEVLPTDIIKGGGK
jgi:hypothetical protein